MKNREVTAAVAAWVGAVIPAIGDKSYGYEPGEKPKGLPDVVVRVITEGAERSPEDFPMLQLQQIDAWVWRLGLSFMYDMGVTEAESAASDAALKDFAETLREALFADPMLGERLVDKAVASPWTLAFDYTAPLVEYEDGTIGRQATALLAVAEPMQAVD